MALSPDLFGLVLSGYLSTVFLIDNIFFPFFLLVWIHYALTWMTKGIGGETDEEQYRFALDQLLYFVAGTLMGLVTYFVTRHRPLIPGDTLRLKKRTGQYVPQLALFVTGYCIQAFIRSIVYIKGLHQVYYPYFPPPDDGEIMAGWWVTAVLTGLGLVAIFLLTLFSVRVHWIISMFIFSYRDNLNSPFITFYIVGLSLLLAPQLLWSYLVTKASPWDFWVAGALSASLVLFVWASFYFAGAVWLRLNTNHFSPLKGRANWGEFCLLNGFVHVAGYIWYIVGGSMGDDRDAFNVTLYTYLGGTLAICILALFIVRRQSEVRVQKRRLAK